MDIAFFIIKTIVTNVSKRCVKGQFTSILTKILSSEEYDVL